MRRHRPMRATRLEQPARQRSWQPARKPVALRLTGTAPWLSAARCFSLHGCNHSTFRHEPYSEKVKSAKVDVEQNINTLLQERMICTYKS